MQHVNALPPTTKPNNTHIIKIIIITKKTTNSYYRRTNYEKKQNNFSVACMIVNSYMGEICAGRARRYIQIDVVYLTLTAVLLES